MHFRNTRGPANFFTELVGVPLDGGTSYRIGTRLGPREIRTQSALTRPYNPVLRMNPFKKLRVPDFGDIDVNPLSIDDTFKRIAHEIQIIIDADTRPFALGGDHSISFPILRTLTANLMFEILCIL